MDVEIKFLNNNLSDWENKLAVQENRLNMYKNFKYEILDLEVFSPKEKEVLLELNTLVFEFEIQVRKIQTKINYYKKEIESLARVV
jgi:uncharacterized coiled-coil protein SlyX